MTRYQESVHDPHQTQEHVQEHVQEQQMIAQSRATLILT